MVVLIRQTIDIIRNLVSQSWVYFMYFMFDEFNIFLHTKSYPLAVLLETAEQTLRPGMYDLIVLVNFPVPIIVIKITQTFQI